MRDPINAFFASQVTTVEDTPIGRQYAMALITEFRKQFPRVENLVLAQYLFAWNAKSSKPFPNDFITDLMKIQVPKRERRKEKPSPETFASKLFDI